VDGLWIETWWGRVFLHPSRPALGPTQPPVQWVLGLSRGKAAGVALTTHPHIVPWLKEEKRYLLSTIHNLEPTAVHKFGSVSVKIESL